MARRIVIDIETVPRPGIMDTWYPQWASEKYLGKEGQDLENMAALHGEFGMITAIAYANALTDEEPKVFTAGSLEEEAEMLEEVYPTLNNMGLTLMGHNIKGFDIPFLAKRYIAQCNRLPGSLNVGGLKPWEVPHKDTMELMRFGGGPSMSLRSACLLFSIKDPKEATCGSDVAELFRQGKIAEIGQYCAGDVVAERALIRRLSDVM